MKSLANNLVAYFTPVFAFQSLKFEKTKVKEYKSKGKEAKKMAKKGFVSTSRPEIGERGWNI
jgi:hypothetical protein